MAAKRKGGTTRRGFLSNAGKGIVLSSMAAGFPAIVPSTVLGAASPGNRINIGAIGVGRISRTHDMPGIWKNERARIIAVCDVDSNRVADAKTLVNGIYSKQTGKPYDGIVGYGDYQALLANRDIDAVVISTPDHWHTLIAIAAVEAGKDVYLQKPASLTIAEGRALSNAVHRSGRIFQIGSQQRSWPQGQFRKACELVRNGRIGELKTVEVGLPGDPSGDEEPMMPVPKNLNYDAWLGSTPVVGYTEKRVHPQVGYDRPGWLRCEQFGAGMITGWGAHHLDTAHWGMDAEYTGPVEVWGTAEFPKKGLWDVHGPFKTEAVYENGVRMIVSGDFPNGIKFIGSEGWLFVSRGDAPAVTASDPTSANVSPLAGKPLAASDPKILTSVIGPDEIHLPESTDHHGNWIASIRSRQQPIAPVEVAHRACSACLLHHIAMKAKRKLFWDPRKERFKNDDEANALLSRPQRWPYMLTT
ncbi:MAG TPA: Gfo/Idh/MocA family oxidoreductase [Vicinamibacterales bacterium]|jgi:predicted dehydrogenase